jgi:hypothetical protein
MKRINIILAVLLITISTSAQYKKASFFGKSGRTIEAGTEMHLFNGGVDNAMGYKIGIGRDRDGNRFFSSWEFEYIPSYKYHYNTTDYNDNPVTVNGSSTGSLIYRFNVGFHLLKNDDAKRVIKPYLATGFSVKMLSGLKGEDAAYTTKMQTAAEAFNLGISIGAGTLINFTPRFGLKLQAGYAPQFNYSVDLEGDSEVKAFYLYRSHPYVSFGFRIRFVEQD